MIARRLFLFSGLAIAAGLLVFRFGVGIQTHEFPCGFRGPAVVVFQHPRGQALSRGLVGGYTLIFDESGILRIRDAAPAEPYFRIKVLETCKEAKVSDPKGLREGSSQLSHGSAEWISYLVNTDNQDERAIQAMISKAQDGM